MLVVFSCLKITPRNLEAQFSKWLFCFCGSGSGCAELTAFGLKTPSGAAISCQPTPQPSRGWIKSGPVSRSCKGLLWKGGLTVGQPAPLRAGGPRDSKKEPLYDISGEANHGQSAEGQGPEAGVVAGPTAVICIGQLPRQNTRRPHQRRQCAAHSSGAWSPGQEASVVISSDGHFQVAGCQCPSVSSHRG